MGGAARSSPWATRGYADAVIITEKPNEPPVAAAPGLVGDPVVSTTLEATYTYDDAEDDPEGATRFRWFRTTNAQGANRTVIPGATSSDYLVSAADLGFWLRVEITPIAQSGALSGAPVELSTAFPVQAQAGGEPPVVTTQPIGGAYQIGERATLDVAYASDLAA